MNFTQQAKMGNIGRYLVTALGVSSAFLTILIVINNANAEIPVKTPNQVLKPIELIDGPALEFRGTISGDVLDMNPSEGEVVTPEVKHFKSTGTNPYIGNDEAIRKGYTIFSTACSGCHGHLAEGKLGPALADEYWTYPKNETDKGLFETIYGGAAGMMGPQQGRLTVDEILHVIAWIRHQADLNASNAEHPHS